jgi:hypothetical protein
MTPTPSPGQERVVDLTGLPDTAVRAIEDLVEVLRRQAAPPGSTVPFSSRGEWVKAIREWAGSHAPHAGAADWGREGIYSGRGE